MIRMLLRSAGILAIGSALGQGGILVATPLLARMYSPAAFGDFALLVSISNIATALACLRYDLAISSAGENFVRGLAKTAALSALFVGLLAGLAALFMQGHYGLLPSTVTPSIVASCVVMVGFYQLCIAGWMRQSAYLVVALLRASQGIGFVILAIASGVGLLWSQVVSFGAGLFVLRAFRFAGRGEGAVESAKIFRKFPLLSLPGALLDVVGYSCCIWVISTSYGGESAGHYSQIQRLIGGPMMLLSISVGQVLLRQIASVEPGVTSIRTHLGRVLSILFALSVLGTLVLWLIGEPLFALILGDGWRTDREFIALISIAVFVRACVSPISMALVARQRFRTALLWQASYFASAVLVMPLAGQVFRFDAFVLFYAIHEVFFYSLYAALIFRAIRND